MLPSDDAYWSIDIPGLTKAQAGALLAYAKDNFDLFGSAADPSLWLIAHMGADTVRPILEAIEIAGDRVEDRQAAGAIRDVFDEWLKRTAL